MTMIAKQKQWRKRIDECTSSGLSIKEWCTVNAISTDQYYYWKRKFNQLDNGIQKPETQWAPLLIEKPKSPIEARLISPQQLRWLLEGLSIDQTKALQKITVSDVC